MGRSNVGKSSVINRVTGRKALARISKTPGRTQQINYFIVDSETRLVDLPGYGFARVSRELQSHWLEAVNDYLQRRKSLCGLILILDIRREPGDEEWRVREWCAAVNLPLHVLFNKADKLSSGAGDKILRDRQSVFGDNTSAQLFSARKGTGTEALRRVLDGWLYGAIRES